MMETIHKGKNKFYIGSDEDDPVAVLNFRFDGEKVMIIEHVYVSKELREQGIAMKLVEEAVNFARAENRKIISLCSYADKVILENKDYADVLLNRSL